MQGPLSRRLVIIGLDCLTPQLLFDAYRDDMPTVARFLEQALYGPLESTIPAITVPAWSVMLSGHDPGELGCYGFRNRADHSYAGMVTANSTAITMPRLWDHVAAAGGRSITLGVPQTYPPGRIDGLVVSCFLAPDEKSDYTWPATLKGRIDAAAGEGGYLIDVRQFRTDDKPWLRNAVFELSRKQFAVARMLLREEEWDCFIMVAMAPDRLHHGFWRFMDPAHPPHDPAHAQSSTIRDYYRELDRELASLLALLRDDDVVLLVSDHGAKALQGGLAINDWLRAQGYLTLLQEPQPGTKFSPALCDWSNTRVWGEGGYYSRIFFNVAGREPQGIVPPDGVAALQSELRAAFTDMAGPDGRRLGNTVHVPAQIYRALRNVPPDLILYPGDLDWRAIGSVGNPSFFTSGNDTGPDDANHAQFGIMALRDGLAQGPRTDLRIYDILPTMLDRCGLDCPAGLSGRVLR
jgi:predicted AlkP superfamily phosphohydrolase/phosphomutase